MKRLISVLLAATLIAGVIGIGAAAENVTYGDVNSNNEISSLDALMIMQHSTGVTELEGSATTAADVNTDGEIDSADALLVLQYTTAVIDEFPVQQEQQPILPETKEEILEYYKEFATKNSDIVTAQSFEMVSVDLGNAILSGLFKPLANMIIDANTMDISGVPGDAQNIRPDDLTLATFVRNNDSTVTVNLGIKSQTDSLVAEEFGGPVGRAVGVLGDIPKRIKDAGAEELLDVSDSTGEFTYDNVRISIVVDENMRPVRGKCSWEYTVYGEINNINITHAATGLGIRNGSGTATVNYKRAY